MEQLLDILKSALGLNSEKLSYSPTNAAAALDISVAQLYRLNATGKIHQDGNGNYPKSELVRFLDETVSEIRAAYEAKNKKKGVKC